MVEGLRTVRMDIAYDGTGFHGWARQEGLATIEGCLRAAFALILGYEPTLRVAGRTDAGVHAREQVVSLRLPCALEPGRVARSLNALTPPAIVVKSVAPAAVEFDARRDAVSRTYRYFLRPGGVVSPFDARHVWTVPYPLDFESMAEAAVLVVGRHDFRAFTPVQNARSRFERTIERCSWHRSGDTWWLEIEAQSFLQHMVRTLVGTMVEVGRGKRRPVDVTRVFADRAREEAGPTAPACGLFLWKVTYHPRRGLKKRAECGSEPA